MTGLTPRIGYLTSRYPAPSHTFIRREVAALRARGLDLSTYSIRPGDVGAGGPLDDDAADSTYAVLAQPLGTFAVAHLGAVLTRPGRYVATLALALRHRVPGMRALVWAVFHFAEAIVLARRLRRDRVGVLHNHFANAGATVGMLAASYSRLPWSLTLHGISEFDYPAGLLLADKIARARFVACVSRFGMAQAMRLVDPVQWPKLRLVRCGVDLGVLPAVPCGKGGNRLVCVGRLSPEKGHAGLLAALADVRRRHPAVELTLVGDGPESQRLRAQVVAAGLDATVRFAGRLDEPATLREIAVADILILPSFMEGLPVVLMEAMALGVPVVATRVAGIPELVRDGTSGLLFDPADWHGLAEAISRLVEDAPLRTRLADAGRATIADGFAVDRAVTSLLALFGAQSEGTEKDA